MGIKNLLHILSIDCAGDFLLFEKLSYFWLRLLGQGGSWLAWGTGLEGDGYFEKVAVQVELEFAALEFRKAFGNAKAKAAAFGVPGYITADESLS